LMIDLIIYKSSEGDYVPGSACSVFDFNQARLNRMQFRMPNKIVEIETHLVGWLVAYTKLIVAAQISGTASVKEVITVSGDDMEGIAKRNREVRLRLFDIRSRCIVEVKYNWEEAISLHGDLVLYLEHRCFEAGADFDSLIDLQSILLPKEVKKDS
jgi:hypothetical protein